MKALKSLAVVAVALAGPGTSFATEVKAPMIRSLPKDQPTHMEIFYRSVVLNNAF